MKAEVTTENRPACNPSQSICIRATYETHKYQCHVQILAVSLFELFVIFIGHPTVILVESRAEIPRGRVRILHLTAEGVLAALGWA